MIEEILNQIELLKIEREQDFKQYQEKMLFASLEERERRGVTWYPVKLVKDFVSLGDRITLELHKTRNFKQKHGFSVGANAAVFTGHGEEGRSIQGVISYLKDHVIKLVINQYDVPDWVYTETIGINLLFDDNTYQEMERALKRLSKAKDNRLAELREIFYGNKAVRFENGHQYQLPSLNEVQNQAFTKIVHALDITLVHGPPGTGKTTTLTKAIVDTVNKEKQVLVCAPSNAAVDLLVEKLAEEGLDVVRLGHPARLTPQVIENSIDIKISRHPQFARLKTLRRKSEEFRKMARKYKRKYGQRERSQRALLFKESKALKEEYKDLESYIAESLVTNAQVIACTLTGANNNLLYDINFKSVFIDEASQALEAASWIPIARAQRVVMSGDHYQLPPTIKSAEAAKHGLENTLFAKGMLNQPEASIMLQTQYRMHPKIANFSSQYFYRSKLVADESILKRDAPFEEHMLFIDTAGAGFEESLKEETLSTYNEKEAKFLLQHVTGEIPGGLSVGIIAPYKAQVELIEKLVNQEPALDPVRKNITVNTVDAFQGQERDIIYISLTRSNQHGIIGFLQEYRRMNVAITRARHQVVMIGDSATLGSDPFFGSLLDYVEREAHYRSVFEYAF
ncbi:MAG: AAA domain-containing protein [Fulvivirga sp.]|nr:AAA domain-containing protein [Fulvivirga sp.]